MRAACMAWLHAVTLSDTMDELVSAGSEDTKIAFVEPVGRFWVRDDGPSRRPGGSRAIGELWELWEERYLDFAEPTDFTRARLAVGRLPDS